ncbi:hypothetical protein M0Q50_06110 [bacterium]|jgi:hypothetical protein|nr:hypothetical protein [bacterium]
MIYNIYKLIDPITNKIKYIGKTSLDIDIRLNQHINESKKIHYNNYKRHKITKKYSWIIKLLKNDKLPTIELIESVNTLEESNEKEIYWIKFYGRDNLLNMTDGGDGGDTNSGKKFGPLSNDIKEKISINTKKAMSDKNIREKCSIGNKMMREITMPDGKMKDETKTKISNTLKQKIEYYIDDILINIFPSINDVRIYFNISYKKYKKYINKHDNVLDIRKKITEKDLF